MLELLDQRTSTLQENATLVALSGDSKSQPSLWSGSWSRQIEPFLRRLEKSDVPILMQGETGVGKEALARCIHDNSPRAGKTFLKLNCAALPSELVECELFGHEKGSFTGAFKSNPGKFELADGGTILLDEIGDMDLRLQAKLLQVLQDHEFYRIGAKEPTRVNVRVLAATHRELEGLIETGQFREDLYYRLNVINISIPPLRERSDEIISLASFFLKKHADDMPPPEIGPELRNALLFFHWPGNIRQLENVMRRYLVIREPRILVEELSRSMGNSRQPTQTMRVAAVAANSNGSPLLLPTPETSFTPMLTNGTRAAAVAANGAGSQPLLPTPGTPFNSAFTREMRADAPQPTLTVQEPHSSAFPAGSDLANLEQARKTAEIELIKKALYSTQWNRKHAAALLGIDYKALLYKMKKLGMTDLLKLHS